MYQVETAELTEGQKKFLFGRTAGIGLLCGILAAALQIVSGEPKVNEGFFWISAILFGLGGGILLGLIPAILAAYRRQL